MVLSSTLLIRIKRLGAKKIFIRKKEDGPYIVLKQNSVYTCTYVSFNTATPSFENYEQD